VGLDPFNVEVSRSHSDTPHSVGLLLASDQLVAQTSTSTIHNTHNIHPSHRRDSNAQFQQASGHRPIRGQGDQRPWKLRQRIQQKRWCPQKSQHSITPQNTATYRNTFCVGAKPAFRNKLPWGKKPVTSSLLRIRKQVSPPSPKRRHYLPNCTTAHPRFKDHNTQGWDNLKCHVYSLFRHHTSCFIQGVSEIKVSILWGNSIGHCETVCV
jgi:hypothetical protein